MSFGFSRALLRRHINRLQFLLRVYVLGVGFQTLLQIVKLGLDVALEAFKKFHTGLAGIAVAHGRRIF